MPIFPPNLKEQIEWIADSSRKNIVDIIIQMEPIGQDLRKLGKAAGEALRRRRLVLSPREVLPDDYSKTRGASRESRRLTASTRTLLGKAMGRAIKFQSLRRISQRSMTPLTTAPIFQSIVQRMIRPRSKSQPDRPAPQPFWTSRSMRLKLTKSQLTQLADVGHVRSIFPNRKMDLPPLKETRPLPIEQSEILSSTWGLKESGALAAWGIHQSFGEEVLVGILDTGIDSEHPDLKGKIRFWQEFDSMGIRVPSEPHDSDLHGTHCAGSIVGGNHSGRHIGMAPAARLAAGLVLDGSIGGTDAQVLAGIDWAVEKQVDVLSLSLGGLVLDANTPETYTQAILSCMEIGIPVVAAIGNEGEQTTGSPGNDLFALSVGAVDENGTVAGFSGGRTQILSGSDFIDTNFLPLAYSKPEVTAPGVAVWSSVPGGSWKALNGTSMATPHVAGCIALLLSATKIRDLEFGHQKANTIRDLVIGSVIDRGERGQDHRYGFGSIDVTKAIDFAKQRGY